MTRPPSGQGPPSAAIARRVLGTVAASARPVSGGPDPDPVFPCAPRARPRVLLAEDDRNMRQLVADLLRRDGYDISEMADGKDLLFWVIKTAVPREDVPEIDLIVSDIRMPYCSGLHVLRMLRRARRMTPVLLMTAFSEPGLGERVRDLGGLLLDKPFTPQELRAAARELLACSAPQSSSRRP